MNKIVITALTMALSGCGGGQSNTTDQQLSAASSVQLIGTYQKNSINSDTAFNSTVADINGDGLDDIVVSGWAKAPAGYTAARSGMVKIKLLIQNSHGNLIDRTNELIGDANAQIWGAQRILVNDFDQDGRLDIAVMGFQDGPSAAPAPSVIFWNDGTMFSRQDLTEPVWAHAACAGDLNNDGKIDLVTGATSLGPNTIYINQEQRNFVLESNLTQETISSAGACAVLNDRGSGRTAIVTSNLPLYPGYSAVIKVWDSKGELVSVKGLPGSEEPGTNAELTNDIVEIIAVDLNHDGVEDLIVVNNGNFRLNSATSYLTVLINQGNFNFVNATQQYLPNQKANATLAYRNRWTQDGIHYLYFDHGTAVSLWQVKNGSFEKHKEAVLNSIVKGYVSTNIYRTATGLSMFMIDSTNLGTAAFYTQSIQ